MERIGFSRLIRENPEMKQLIWEVDNMINK